MIKPGPGDSVLTRLDASRYGPVEDARASGGRVFVQVARGGSRTTADNALDNHPLGVLSGLQISRERHLARAASMRRSTDEAESLRDADRSSVAGTLSVIDAGALLAREIRSVAGERGVIKTRFAIWHRASHHHMGMCDRSHIGNGRKGSIFREDRHFG